MTAEHPEGWTPADGEGVSPEEVAAEIRAEATEHGGDYAAGMRLAATIVEDASPELSIAPGPHATAPGSIEP